MEEENLHINQFLGENN